MNPGPAKRGVNEIGRGASDGKPRLSAPDRPSLQRRGRSHSQRTAQASLRNTRAADLWWRSLRRLQVSGLRLARGAARRVAPRGGGPTLPGVRIWTRTVTAFLVVGVIAAGCGVDAKSDKHAAGVCDSVEPLLKTRRSLDALDRKAQNANRVVTSPNDLRRLSLTYRHEATAYADLEANAKAYVGKVDAGEGTGTIKRMWRQLAASLHERKMQMLYFADTFAKLKQPGTNRGQFTALNHHAVIQRANAQYVRMESVMENGLRSLGFKQRRGVFFIDC